jgi:hypothetical protein
LQRALGGLDPLRLITASIPAHGHLGRALVMAATEELGHLLFQRPLRHQLRAAADRFRQWMGGGFGVGRAADDLKKLLFHSLTG